jgi:transmembrane sensor
MEANDRRERAAQEAAEWFVRLDSDLPREERAQFVAWLHESPIHVAEMIRMAQVHGALRNFGPWGQSAGTVSPAQHDTVVPFPVRPGARVQPRASGEPDDDETSQRIASQADASRAVAVRGDGSLGDSSRGASYWLRAGQRRRIAKLMWTGAAAAIAMLVLATGIILPKFRGQVIDTERGERREVVLDDGSIVLVDPETSMRVKYETGSRRVFLERGRALFRVAKNPGRPFLVEVEGTVVRAVGTAFGVEQQAQGVVVTVAEGKVAVLSSPESARSQGAAAQPGRAHAFAQGSNLESLPLEPQRKEAGLLFLTSDQQVTVPRRGAIETVRTVDSRRELAWAEGRLVFRNYTVARVVAEFNRYNRVQLEVTDPVLAGRTVSGVFNASDPESFISFLQTVAPVSVLHRDEHTIAIALSRTN